LAVVAEPYCVPDTPGWIRDLNGSAAVAWTSALDAPGVLLCCGSGFVAVEWAGMVLVGVYVSPNISLAGFGDFLDGVESCVRRYLPRQVLVLGDFNAHSSLWGNPRTDARGKMLSD
jgi:hypothetical protein